LLWQTRNEKGEEVGLVVNEKVGGGAGGVEKIVGTERGGVPVVISILGRMVVDDSR
jgi:hypothetical protein